MTGARRWAILVLIGALGVAAIIGWSRSSGPEPLPAPPPPAEAPATPLEAPAAPPPDPAEREAKRFDRYDRDDDGLVTGEEYLYSRRRSFERMDEDGDGRIDFTEYSVKQRGRIEASDCDASGDMTPEEFASTATRKDAPEPDC